MLEKDIENLISLYPDEFFPNEQFRLIGQQVNLEGRRLDILFEDQHKRKIIVEVKRGILTREASGQIAEYYGLLKNLGLNENCELILCANIIPKERKTFLEAIGIDCKELGITLLWGVGGGKIQSSSWLLAEAAKDVNVLADRQTI